LAIASQELVGRVDIEHVMHGSECKVFLDKGSAIHESSDLAHEVKDLIPGALSTTREVLASELGDPDGFVESVVHVGYVVNEVLRVSTVPVESDGINLATTTAAQEILNPFLARWSVGAGRGNEEIALILERVEVLAPEVRTMLRRHVGLTRLVRLVEAQSAMCVTGLD